MPSSALLAKFLLALLGAALLVQGQFNGIYTVRSGSRQFATSMNRMFADATSFNQNLQLWNAGFLRDCQSFAVNATAWLAAYGNSIAGKTPPLSASMIFAGCGAT